MSNENNDLVVREQLSSITQMAQFNHIEVATTIKDAIKNGEVDPLKVHMFLKRTEKLAELVKADNEVKEAITNAATMYSPDKPFDFLGASLKVGAVHTAYDFSECGDLLWNNLNEMVTKFTAMKKAREEQLKVAFPENIGFGFKPPRMIIDHLYHVETVDCGEEVVLNQPKKIQQMGVKVTFKKSK